MPSGKQSISPNADSSTRPSRLPSTNTPTNLSSLPSVIPSLFSTRPGVPTLHPTEASTLTSGTATYQQSYAGFDELSLLNETQIETYEANMENQAAENTNIKYIEVEVSNQEITTMSNRRWLQEQNWTKILTITYNLTALHKNIDEISAFLQSHVSNMMHQKNEINKFMIDEGIKIDEVLTITEVSVAPSISFQPSSPILVKHSNSPSSSYNPSV